MYIVSAEFKLQFCLQDQEKKNFSEFNKINKAQTISDKKIIILCRCLLIN